MILFNAVFCLIYLAAMVISCTWKPRPGKMLFCMFLLLSAITSFLGFAINIIINSEVGKIFTQYLHLYSYFSTMLHLVAVILLFSFVVISREYYVPVGNYDDGNRP